MTTPHSAWDALSWKEQDNKWTAGCRWLQSWYRDTELGIGPGEQSKERPHRLVASMLPLGSDRKLNFLSDEILAVVDARLEDGTHSGIIEKDRLFRNLLSSQPASFNLFAPFVTDPTALVPWIRTLDGTADRIDRILFEWAPDPRLHFDGGSAFDVFIEYSSSGEPCFLGVECKYAENLGASSIRVREPYVEFTTTSSAWRDGAARRLDVARLRQFWLNILLAQSLVEREQRFRRGSVVIVACNADVSAREATALVRAELETPDAWLRWSPYEDVLSAVQGHESWSAAFRRRYLDFIPVRHLLAADDPRVAERHSGVDGLHDLSVVAQRVTGEGSILEQILTATADGQLGIAESLDFEGLNARAAEVAVDLKVWRQAASAIWQRPTDI